MAMNGDARPRVVIYGFGQYGKRVAGIAAAKGWPIAGAVNRVGDKTGLDLGRVAGLANDLNAISPGFFKSNLTSFTFDDEGLYERFKKTNPVPREGRPEEIAGLAIYLTSRAGNYMTGSVVDIDGGLSFTS